MPHRRFKVMHDDAFGRDDFAAWACFRLDRLGSGFRFVHLFDAHGVQSTGVILVRITKSLDCGADAHESGAEEVVKKLSSVVV